MNNHSIIHCCRIWNTDVLEHESRNCNWELTFKSKSFGTHWLSMANPLWLRDSPRDGDPESFYRTTKALPHTVVHKVYLESRVCIYSRVGQYNINNNAGWRSLSRKGRRDAKINFYVRIQSISWPCLSDKWCWSGLNWVFVVTFIISISTWYSITIAQAAFPQPPCTRNMRKRLVKWQFCSVGCI